MSSLKILFFVSFLLISVMSSLTGGWVELTDGEQIKKLSDKIVQKINTESNGLYHNFVTEVVKAESHIVSGVEYKLVLVVAESSCTKNEVVNSQVSVSDCKERDGASKKTYEVTVWEQPWLDHDAKTTITITELSVHNSDYNKE